MPAPGALLDEIVTLARLGRILDKYADPELPLAQYRVLALIAGGDARASRIARKLAVGKPSITATVEALTAKGLVVRGELIEDRRGGHLAVTSAGEAALAAGTTQLAAVLAEVLNRCEDPDMVRAALAQLGVALEERAEFRDSTATG